MGENDLMISLVGKPPRGGNGGVKTQWFAYKVLFVKEETSFVELRFETFFV